MKTFTVSDVHGMVFWKYIIARARPEDEIVFLGDYFDKRGNGPYAESQTENFLEICALARGNPNVHLLLGNHDFQYTSFTNAHLTTFDRRNGREFGKALMDNMDLLKIAHMEIKGEKAVIFSHAGVSQTFLHAAKLSSVDEINSLFQARPWEFEFSLFYNGQLADKFGDNIWQSPLWIRPDALLQDAVPGYEQVVGHTMVENIQERISVNGDKIYFTCSFDENCLVL